MNSILVTYFILYTVLLGTIVFIGFLIQKRRETNYSNNMNAIPLSEIVVLIPFRNEEKRIHVLLDSIKTLKNCPKEFVFINDHSTDNGADLIEREMKNVRHSILSLPEGINGKKRALRYAIASTDSTYILTLDADVELSPEYFTSLAKLNDADMYVLPAIMAAKSFKEYFYEIDLVLVNAANAGLTGLARPIMASGANLLYKRETFNRVDNLESHINAASGDDTYLLRDFRENKTDIRLCSNVKYALHTETPQSFKEFIDQRLRWIGKTGDIKDHLNTSLAVIQSILTLFFLVLIVVAIIQMDEKLLVTIFGAKSIIDLILFFPYFQRINRLITWCFIPFYELLFPFYVILILSLMFVYKPSWKGREIYTNNIKS